MDKIAYLATFVSLILGLALANVLRQFTAMVKRGRSADWYWIHTAWSVFLFFALASEWWVLLLWEKIEPIGFYDYLAILVKPSLWFIASDLLFPDRRAEATLDLRAHFYQVRRAFFLVLLLYPFADVLDTFLKGWQHFWDLGWIYSACMVGAVAGAVLGAISDDERVHGGLVVSAFVIMIAGMLNALAYID